MGNTWLPGPSLSLCRPSLAHMPPHLVRLRYLCQQMVPCCGYQYAVIKYGRGSDVEEEEGRSAAIKDSIEGGDSREHSVLVIGRRHLTANWITLVGWLKIVRIKLDSCVQTRPARYQQNVRCAITLFNIAMTIWLAINKKIFKFAYSSCLSDFSALIASLLLGTLKHWIADGNYIKKGKIIFLCMLLLKPT